MTSKEILSMSDANQSKTSAFCQRNSNNWLCYFPGRRAPICINFVGASFNRKESSCLAGSTLFSSSLFSSCLGVRVLLFLYTLDDIMKHCHSNCWTLRISLTPFFVGKRIRRCLVEITLSSLLNPGYPRMTLYIEDTQTTMNITWGVLYRGGIPVMMEKVISPSILIDFLEKSANKGISTHFSWFSDRFIQAKAS